MDTALIVAWTAGGFALASTLGTVASSIYNSHQTNKIAHEIASQRDKIAEEEKVEISMREMARYSEPLLRSAFDLQSRLYNIVAQNALHAFSKDIGGRKHHYIIENTVFLFSQYFCWTEIARKQICFIDLGEDQKTRHLLYFQDNITRALGSDSMQKGFKIFAGEQRAIGETMIQIDTQGLTCMGYAEFLEVLKPGKNSLIDTLRDEICNITRQPEFETKKFVITQNILIQIVDLLDPSSKRFPPNLRSKLNLKSS